MSSDATQKTQTLLDKVDEFLGRYYEEAIAELAQSYPRDATALTVSYWDVFQFDPDLADDLVEQPDQIRRSFEEALKQFALPADISLDGVDVRFSEMPETREYTVGGYRSTSIGELIAVQGQVSKRTGVKSLPVTAVFECLRCGTLNDVPQDDGDIDEPHECAECERQGPFELHRSQSEWVDIQQLRLQLPPEQAQGASSTSLDVSVRGDLVNEADAGDRVTVAGVHDVTEDDELGFKHTLQADDIHIEETDYQSIDTDAYRDEIEALANGEHGDPYELLVDSIAPEIIGHDDIKRALALQLFGGVQCETPNGSHKRGDIHILLLGDPGTAKSTMLEAVQRIAPRSAMASGKGATEAGITASAVKDDFGGDQWTLEAGTVVLADGGVACLDELDKIDENVVQALHEAMSRQIVPIDKAGINCELPSRTAVLAAGNPKHGRFDRFEPLPEQIDLGPTLLSRFDLMFLLQDQPDEETDREIAAGKIENRNEAIKYSAGERAGDDCDIAPAVAPDLLRAWVAHAKQTVQPTWDDGDIQEFVQESYLQLRLINDGDGDDPVPATHRALDAMQRLAEASARVRLSETVEKEDVERATDLYWTALADVGKDPESGQVDADMVETGQSKSQRDRVQAVYDIITELQAEYDSGVPSDVVEDRAEEAGFERSKVISTIGSLKEAGKVYGPSSDTLRTT